MIFVDGKVYKNFRYSIRDVQRKQIRQNCPLTCGGKFYKIKGNKKEDNLFEIVY